MNEVRISYNLHKATRSHGKFMMRIKSQNGLLIESIISHQVQELIDFIRERYPSVEKIIWALVP